MAVTGKLRPNEQIVYAFDGTFPTFVRRTYEFKGLGSMANGDAGATVLETEIVAICRGASVLGVPLPPADELIAGIPQSRVTVRRYERARGNATIVVDWGFRFIGGGGVPDVKRERSKTFQSQQAQPYMVLTMGDTASIWERQTRSILRPAVRVTLERVVTDNDSGSGSTALVDAILSSIGNLIPWRGRNRYIVGGGFSPFSQTQGYISITMDFYGPMAALAQDEIIFGEGHYGSLPVAALLENQQYGVPNSIDGTPALPLPQVVPPFNWMVS